MHAVTKYSTLILLTLCSDHTMSYMVLSLVKNILISTEPPRIRPLDWPKMIILLL